MRLISLQAAAEYADVHVRTIRRWIAQGILPAHRTGPRLIRVTVDDLNAVTSLVTQATHAPPTPAFRQADRVPAGKRRTAAQRERDDALARLAIAEEEVARLNQILDNIRNCLPAAG